MSTPLKVLALTLLICGSTACSHIGSKSPDEMVRYAMQHNLTRDNQYQFEGHARLVADEQPALPHADSDGAADPAASTSASASAGGSNALMRHMLMQTQMRYSGAVDIPQRKIEIIPEMHYQNRQALLSAKLPMQFDLRTLNMVADPGAIAPFMDAFTGAKGQTAIGDKLVQINLSQLIQHDIPTETLLQGLPKAMDEGFASFDKKAFTRMDMDADGRKAGARYRVRLESNMSDGFKQTQAMLGSLVTHLQEDGKRHEHMPEGHRLTIHLLEGAQSFYQQIDSADKARPLMQDMADLYDTPIHTDYYLDGKGRIVALRQSTKLTPLQALLGKQPLRQDLWLSIRYTRPQFTLKPTAANTMDLNALLPSLGGPATETADNTQWDDLRRLGVAVESR